MIRNIFIQVLIITILSGCEKIYYYPDRPLGIVTTKFLAHRGSGNPERQQNNLEAAKYGLKRADGIEVDIQISKDRTIWLSHDVKLPECGGIKLPCFPEVRDNEIIELDSCLGISLTYTRLNEIFQFMRDSFPQSYISLDVKAWNPCKFTSLEITGILNAIADQIAAASNFYQLNENVMVESEVASFLNYLKRKSNNRIKCYLTTLGDFERGMLLALKAGYEGITFKYNFDEKITVDHISLLHKKGIKIQLWTLNDEEIIDEALLLCPDFIITDNVNYTMNLRAIQP
jgi:glycerophosphoryl diester phosphodiesterase